jgi:hypothetical protein
MNIIFQGTLGGECLSQRIVCTSATLTITDISINNILPYTFSLKRFTLGKGSVLIYTFTLDAEDNLRDNENYILNTGDYLELISNTTDTSFYVSAFQS